VRRQQSRRKIRGLLNQRNEIKIELGSGDKKRQQGWLTINITKVCDIYWDLRKGLPFPNGTVSKIYSPHFFEHLSFAETRDFLQQCRRALKPENFLICVSNAQIYLEAYVLPKQRHKPFL
jgi:predicted SAM-dependent methyltransferase